MIIPYYSSSFVSVNQVSILRMIVNFIHSVSSNSKSISLSRDKEKGNHSKSSSSSSEYHFNVK